MDMSAHGFVAVGELASRNLDDDGTDHKTLAGHTRRRDYAASVRARQTLVVKPDRRHLDGSTLALVDSSIGLDDVLDPATFPGRQLPCTRRWPVRHLEGAVRALPSVNNKPAISATPGIARERERRADIQRHD